MTMCNRLLTSEQGTERCSISFPKEDSAILNSLGMPSAPQLSGLPRGNLFETSSIVSKSISRHRMGQRWEESSAGSATPSMVPDTEVFHPEQLDPAQSGRWGRTTALLAKDFCTADATRDFIEHLAIRRESPLFGASRFARAHGRFEQPCWQA